MLLKKYVSQFVANPVIGRLVLFIVFVSGAQNSAFGQHNIQFTQYMFNTLSVNPAYAGYKEDWYLQGAHRMQWDGIYGAPVTTQISVDGVTNYSNKNVGLGLQLTSDKIGAQSSTSVYADYAYRLQLDNIDMSRLSFGIGVGLTQYSTDISQLDPIEANDPILTNYVKDNYIPDVRLGVYYYNSKFFAGLSGMDLLCGEDPTSIFNWNPDTTVNVIRKRHFYLISGGLFELTNYTKIRPNLMIREDFKGPTNLDLSAVFIFDNKFWVGASYRTAVDLWSKTYDKVDSQSYANALCGILEFQINERLRIGYSYDFALNSLSTYQKGTHEITLGWLIFNKSRRVLSPRFF